MPGPIAPVLASAKLVIEIVACDEVESERIHSVRSPEYTELNGLSEDMSSCSIGHRTEAS